MPSPKLLDNLDNSTKDSCGACSGPRHLAMTASKLAQFHPFIQMLSELG